MLPVDVCCAVIAIAQTSESKNVIASRVRFVKVLLLVMISSLAFVLEQHHVEAAQEWIRNAGDFSVRRKLLPAVVAGG